MIRTTTLLAAAWGLCLAGLANCDGGPLEQPAHAAPAQRGQNVTAVTADTPDATGTIASLRLYKSTCPFNSVVSCLAITLNGSATVYYLPSYGTNGASGDHTGDDIPAFSAVFTFLYDARRNGQTVNLTATGRPDSLEITSVW